MCNFSSLPLGAHAVHCPFCHTPDTRVIDSRLVGDGNQTRRRRECISCLARFTTYESIELALPRLEKKDGSFVQFKEEKLRNGILRALEKRPISMNTVDEIINRLIFKLRTAGERDISTKILGAWVMSELKSIDEVAYVRFASVYRRFEDIDAFQNEIELLRNTVDELI
jgi:transcriptional repressor NrdR